MSTADGKIREFVAKQRELLDLELQAEAQEESVSGGALTVDDERRSHILGSLESSDVSVGLYGRTVVELSMWSEKVQCNSASGYALLPAHRFTVGDDVEIRSKRNKNAKSFPSGVISAVSDTTISVVLFPGRSTKSIHHGKTSRPRGEEDEQDDGLNLPPLSLVPRSSVEVHRKMMQGLEKLERCGVDHLIAGGVVEALFHPAASNSLKHSTRPFEPFDEMLDTSQLEAIDFALHSDRPVALIHGPPGTGKTTTVAELIRQAVLVQEMKVLVTAPSNVAVDNILERLMAPLNPPTEQSNRTKGKRRGNASKTKIRAVRLGHPARIKSSILPYSLDALVQSADGTEIVDDVRKELHSFLRVLSNSKSKPNDKRVAYREVKSLRKEIRVREEKVVQGLMSTAQVVLATTIGASNGLLDKVDGGFDIVIIDEAAQALEASCWIPILRGRRLVLAGDHCQLPPTIKTKNHRAQLGLSKTLFERLMQLYGDDKMSDEEETPQVSRMLKVQYRMHEDIASWASHAMYGGKLWTHESVKNRTLGQLENVKMISGADGPSKLADTTMLLIDTAGCDMFETVNAAGSRFNQGEADIVAQHVRKLILMGLKQQEIAIITPYNGQVELLRNILLPEFQKLEIRSVDGFQGGERTAVVLSLVRSSERGGKAGIGFLRDDRRQNVAATRAMRHLAVVCDTETVSKSFFIGSLISWIEEHGDQQSAVEFTANGSRQREKENDFAKQNVESSFKVSDRPEKKTETTDEQARKFLLDRIAAFAETGAIGEELTLSSELSSYDRRIVHEFAEQLGLGHRSEGVDGVDRMITLRIQKSSQEAIVLEPPTAHIQEAEDFPKAGTSCFAPLAEIDESDSDEEKGEEASPPPEVPALECENALLSQLAREREARHSEREVSGSNASGTPGALQTKKKSKKGKGRKLGGNQNRQRHEKQDDVDELSELDDMAFLDAQIERSQNSHGRKVVGTGRSYRTIVNGILNTRPEPAASTKNCRAAASLQSKLKDAKDARTKAKPTKKKRK